jgi:4'-phosphopantetheinyl transferase
MVRSTDVAGGADVDAPGAGEVRVWWARSDGLGEADLAACAALLDAGEAARLAGRRAPEARRGSLAVHALLRIALARALGCAPGAVALGREAGGRPFLAAPAPARALRISLSHAPGLVACALAGDAEVGVDVEDLGRRLPRARALAERFFAAAEARWLGGLPAQEIPERFLELWTCKEAYAKGRGRALGEVLSDCAVEIPAAEPGSSSPGGDAPRLRLAAALGDDAALWTLRLLRPAPRHLLAVAARRARGPVTMQFREQELGAEAIRVQFTPGASDQTAGAAAWRERRGGK